MYSREGWERTLIDQLIENTQGFLGDVSAFMLPEGGDTQEMESSENEGE